MEWSKNPRLPEDNMMHLYCSLNKRHFDLWLGFCICSVTLFELLITVTCSGKDSPQPKCLPPYIILQWEKQVCMHTHPNNSSQIETLSNNLIIMAVLIMMVVMMMIIMILGFYWSFATFKVLYYILYTVLGFSGSSVDKESTGNAGDTLWVRSLGQEDPLEEGMATHFSILAWRILWTEEPGGLQSVGSQKS